MKYLIVIACFLIVSCSPKQIKFDKIKWQKSFDGYYEFRENMTTDLMDNHLNKGMAYDSVIKLLGEPANLHNKEENEIVYEIMVDYKGNIDPMDGTDLHIEFDKDSLIQNFRLNHW